MKNIENEDFNAAIAVSLLVGVLGSTNSATVSISIHDLKTRKMIWNFDHKLSGSAFSTPAQIVDDLMRKASKKMQLLFTNYKYL